MMLDLRMSSYDARRFNTRRFRVSDAWYQCQCWYFEWRMICHVDILAWLFHINLPYLIRKGIVRRNCLPVMYTLKNMKANSISRLLLKRAYIYHWLTLYTIIFIDMYARFKSNLDMLLAFIFFRVYITGRQFGLTMPFLIKYGKLIWNNHAKISTWHIMRHSKYQHWHITRRWPWTF
jgi:hypothetical protein